MADLNDDLLRAVELALAGDGAEAGEDELLGVLGGQGCGGESA